MSLRSIHLMRNRFNIHFNIRGERLFMRNSAQRVYMRKGLFGTAIFYLLLLPPNIYLNLWRGEKSSRPTQMR